jgi:membrane carboxypeptidase/penicillin-binding protein
VYPSLALGASEVTLLEITGAYAALAAQGHARAPTLVRGCMSSGGGVVRLRPLDEPPGVEPQEAYMVTHLLEGVMTSGTGRGAAQWGVHGPVAGKTGTTDEYRDAWFVGFDPRRAVGVWVGFDQDHEVGLSGAAAALPVWAGIFSELQGPDAGREFPAPPGVVTVPICVESGMHATEYCPVVTREVFLEGTAPGNACDVHHGGFFDRLRDWLDGDDVDEDEEWWRDSDRDTQPPPSDGPP